MKKISENTISLLKSYLALKVIAEIETDKDNKTVDEILARNRYKVDMTKVSEHDYYKEIYNKDSVILSHTDNALYTLMADADIEQFKAEQKAAGIMNENETSKCLCTESNMREVLRLFLDSCLSDIKMQDLSGRVLSLDHFNTLKELCIGLVVSYCKVKNIELNITA